MERGGISQKYIHLSTILWYVLYWRDTSRDHCVIVIDSIGTHSYVSYDHPLTTLVTLCCWYLGSNSNAGLLLVGLESGIF